MGGARTRTASLFSQYAELVVEVSQALVAHRILGRRRQQRSQCPEAAVGEQQLTRVEARVDVVCVLGERAPVAAEGLSWSSCTNQSVLGWQSGGQSSGNQMALFLANGRAIVVEIFVASCEASEILTELEECDAHVAEEEGVAAVEGARGLVIAERRRRVAELMRSRAEIVEDLVVTLRRHLEGKQQAAQLLVLVLVLILVLVLLAVLLLLLALLVLLLLALLALLTLLIPLLALLLRLGKGLLRARSEAAAVLTVPAIKGHQRPSAAAALSIDKNR